jgi:hypothetical protein
MSIDRRQFLGYAAGSAALVGLGAAAGWFLRDRSGPRMPLGPATPTGGQPNALDYDLSQYMHVDPALVRYKPAGSFAAPRGARALAVKPEGLLLIAAGAAVHCFDAHGQTGGEWLSTATTARALVFDADGNLLVATQKTVEVYGPNGSLESTWDIPRGGKEPRLITSIAATGDHVFLADALGRIIVRTDRQGGNVKLLGAADAARNIPGFILPSPYFQLVIGRDGLLWVNNPGKHRVEAYTFDGDFEQAWGENSIQTPGFCGCCNPVGLATLPDGKFLTGEKGLRRVKVYRADGVFESIVAPPDAFAPSADDMMRQEEAAEVSAKGLAVAAAPHRDATGRVYVLDQSARLVQVFVPKDRAV